MRFFRFVKYFFYLIGNIRKYTSTSQFIIFLVLFSLLIIIGIVSFIKVVIPFTYIAL